MYTYTYLRYSNFNNIIMVKIAENWYVLLNSASVPTDRPRSSRAGQGRPALAGDGFQGRAFHVNWAWIWNQRAIFCGKNIGTLW